MKALIRNLGETVTEDMHIPGIEWDTGMPLTNPVWAGGPYQLVDNYVEIADGAIYDVAVYPEPEDNVQNEQPKTEEKIVKDINDYVIIDGKKYSKTKLRSLLE